MIVRPRLFIPERFIVPYCQSVLRALVNQFALRFRNFFIPRQVCPGRIHNRAMFSGKPRVVYDGTFEPLGLPPPGSPFATSGVPIKEGSRPCEHEWRNRLEPDTRPNVG